MTTLDHLALLHHELRSPVAALAALALAAPSASSSADARRLVSLAIAAGRDIERLVGDLDPTSLRLEQVDVGSLVAGFERQSVAVAVWGRPLARADPTRLRQVLANLIANGLRHGSHVELAARSDGTEVVVEVSDDGPGVEPGADHFALGTSGAGSTGYGLWLARAVADAHGGSLELASGPGEATRFRLVLPSASGGS
ncbi:MAG: sensor histidine kinase [Gaiella sp.]